MQSCGFSLQVVLLTIHGVCRSHVLVGWFCSVVALLATVAWQIQLVLPLKAWQSGFSVFPNDVIPNAVIPNWAEADIDLLCVASQQPFSGS